MANYNVCIICEKKNRGDLIVQVKSLNLNSFQSKQKSKKISFSIINMCPKYRPSSMVARVRKFEFQKWTNIKKKNLIIM